MLAILEALKTQVPGLVEGGALDPEEEISILGASRAAWRGGWEHLHTRRPWALAVPRRGRSWSRRGHTCWILTDCTTLGRAAGAWPQHLPVGARRQRPPLGAPPELDPGTRPKLALNARPWARRWNLAPAPARRSSPSAPLGWEGAATTGCAGKKIPCRRAAPPEWIWEAEGRGGGWSC